MDGNGVGPVGSVHFSSKILPTESSRSFMTPMSVFNSFILTYATFLDTQRTAKYVESVNNRDALFNLSKKLFIVYISIYCVYQMCHTEMSRFCGRGGNFEGGH